MAVKEFKKRIDDSWSRCVKKSELIIEEMNHHKVSADAIEEACEPIDTCISSFLYEIKQLDQTSFSSAEQAVCKVFLNRKIIEANFKLADIYRRAAASGWKEASFLSITNYLQAMEISVKVSDSAQIVKDAEYVMEYLKTLPETTEREDAIKKIDKIQLDVVGAIGFPLKGMIDDLHDEHLSFFQIVSVKELKEEVNDVWKEYVEYSEHYIKKLKRIRRNHGVKNLSSNKEAILAFGYACNSINAYIANQSESYLHFLDELSWSPDKKIGFIIFLHRKQIEALFKLANYYELGVRLALAEPSEVIDTYLDAIKISESIPVPDINQIESDLNYAMARLQRLKKTIERDDAITKLHKIQVDTIGLYLRRSVEGYLYTERSLSHSVAFFPLEFNQPQPIKISNITGVILKYLR